MMTHGPKEAVKLRALAAQFRAFADETREDPYRQRFEVVAEELEEAAAEAETRPDLKQIS